MHFGSAGERQWERVIHGRDGMAAGPGDRSGEPVRVQRGAETLEGEALIAPGEDGMGSVELANVIVYSSLLGLDVKLPMDAAAFETKLQELIASSKLEKKVVEIKDDDFTKSFHR